MLSTLSRVKLMFEISSQLKYSLHGQAKLYCTKIAIHISRMTATALVLQRTGFSSKQCSSHFKTFSTLWRVLEMFWISPQLNTLCTRAVKLCYIK